MSMVVGSPNPKAKRNFLIECSFWSFRIVHDLDKHSNPCIPYMPVIDGNRKRRGRAQQITIIILDLNLVNIFSDLFGKNMMTHLKNKQNWIVSKKGHYFFKCVD